MYKNTDHILAGVAAASIIISGISAVPAYAYEKDSVYLSSLSLSKSNIDFSEDVFYYTARVDDDADEIKIRAKPKNEDSSVSIDGNYVDKDDNYKRTIELEKGSNIIKVVVDNGDDSKTYTINVIKGDGEKDDVFLDKLKVDNKTIDLNNDITEYSMDVENEVDKVRISAVPELDNCDVSIDGGNVTDDYTTSVNLIEGNNPIVIKVTKKKEEREYLLNINRKSVFESGSVQDDIYLDYMKIEKTKIDLSKDKTEYNAEVDEDVDNIYVTAEPENDDYKVKINDKIVEEEDKYKDFIKLTKGKNRIKVVLQDQKNNKQRVYYLNIYRGKYLDSNQQNQNNTIENKNNKWIKTEKGWQYTDAIGHVIKSTWFYDINYGSWYYLDSDGVMKTGWFKDINGKWYYFDNYGSMVHDVYVNGYWLGSDGAMV